MIFARRKFNKLPLKDQTAEISTLLPRVTIALRLWNKRTYQKGFGLGRKSGRNCRKTIAARSSISCGPNDFRLNTGDLTFLLAMEFGFCYGVERAVEYAYETVAKFPDRRIFLTGEIIHNPHVNDKLQTDGHSVPAELRTKSTTPLQKDDVVIVPAFGIPATDIDLLSKKGCVVVDTTCGSVLNVWKNVERYAGSGITSVIHGKFEHEETQATFSRASLYPKARISWSCATSPKRRTSAEYIRGRRRSFRIHGTFC